MKFFRSLSIGLCALLACVQLNAVRIWLDQNGLFSVRSVEIYAMDFSWEDLDVYIRDGYVADGQQIDESLCFSIQFANEPALQVVCQGSSDWDKSMVETLDSSVLREYGINDLKIKAFVPTSGDQAVNVLNQLAPEQEQKSYIDEHDIKFLRQLDGRDIERLDRLGLAKLIEEPMVPLPVVKHQQETVAVEVKPKVLDKAIKALCVSIVLYSKAVDVYLRIGNGESMFIKEVQVFDTKEKCKELVDEIKKKDKFKLISLQEMLHKVGVPIYAPTTNLNISEVLSDLIKQSH